MSTEPGKKQESLELENKLNSFQLNSLVTLADLALNCSNSDRDHCYSVDYRNVSTGILDKECLVQKEKDHTYAFSGRTKSAMGLAKQIPRRSSSEENVSRNVSLNNHVAFSFTSSAEKYFRFCNKKSQSYEEILQQGGSSQVNGSVLSVPEVPQLFSGPSIQHLKITGDLASSLLPCKDHTYASANGKPSTDVEMICDTRQKVNPALNKRLSRSHEHNDHIYNKINVNQSSSAIVINTIDIPTIWSRKSDHSYFTFDQPMRDQMLGKSQPDSSKSSADVFQHSNKRDRPDVRSDHTYFSLA